MARTKTKRHHQYAKKQKERVTVTYSTITCPFSLVSLFFIEQLLLTYLSFMWLLPVTDGISS